MIFKVLEIMITILIPRYIGSMDVLTFVFFPCKQLLWSGVVLRTILDIQHILSFSLNEDPREVISTQQIPGKKLSLVMGSHFVAKLLFLGVRMLMLGSCHNMWS